MLEGKLGESIPKKQSKGNKNDSVRKSKMEENSQNDNQVKGTRTALKEKNEKVAFPTKKRKNEHEPEQ